MTKVPMDAGMQRVIERFPTHAAAIRRLFHADQSFREMCGDYAETLEALQRWQGIIRPAQSGARRGIPRTRQSAGRRGSYRAWASAQAAKDDLT
jgi:hypothetical protein